MQGIGLNIHPALDGGVGDGHFTSDSANQTGADGNGHESSAFCRSDQSGIHNTG